jgi:soluble P-type ATPase
MFGPADLSVAVIEREGTYAGLIASADVLTTSILDALDLLLKPGRLKATLRS